MTEAKKLKIKTSLALKMERPGGRSFQEIAQRADGNLEGHREAVMAIVAERVEALEALCARQDPCAGGAVYALASEIVDLAGYFDTGPLYEAAYSLCDIADRMLGLGVWLWPPVQVHGRALRLILAEGCRVTSASRQILEGLHAVARKCGGAA